MLSRPIFLLRTLSQPNQRNPCSKTIPAYDIRENLIKPSDYEEKLAGAIVRVYFTIVHFYFQRKKRMFSIRKK
jgi:hypothetical protein